MAIIVAQEDPKPKNPKITVAANPVSDIQPQTGSAISQKYTKGFVPFLESQKNYVAGQQGGAAEFGNMLGQSVLGALTGTVETIAYWADLDERIGNRFREQKEYQNWVGDAMKAAKEAGNAQLPVYKSEDNEQFNPASSEWWMAHGGDTIGSVLGLMLPGLGVAKVAKALKVGATGEAIAGAVAARTAESTMEANDSFQTAYATAKQQGLDEDTARKIASKAGAKTWDSNWVFALQDVMQFSALTKGLGTAAKGMKGQTIKNILGLATNAASEGAEEGGQYIVSKEAIKAAMGDENDYFGKDFGKRLTDYIDDDEFKTSVTLGAAGGTVFQGAGHLSSAPLERVGEKIANIAKRGLQREQANSVDDTATSQKTTNIDAADQLVDRLNKGKLSEYLEELDTQIKQTGLSPEGRENVQNQMEDVKQILTEESKLKNSNTPQEMHKPILLRHLEKSQLSRLDKQLTKDVNNLHQNLATSEELPEGLGELKKLQTSVEAYKRLAIETKSPEIQKKATLLENQYNTLVAETKKNPLVNIAFPDLEKALVTTKDAELVKKTYQLASVKEKNAAITEELKHMNTPAGAAKARQAVADKKVDAVSATTLKDPKATKEQIVQAAANTKSEPLKVELAKKYQDLIDQDKEANKEKTAEVVDSSTNDYINPEVDIDPDISYSPEERGELGEFYDSEQPDFDPFANIDPSTLAAFGQTKPQDEIVERISTEQEKKDPKPSRLQAKKAEKIKNEYLENQTVKTWFKEFQSVKVDNVWTLRMDAEGYPIEQEYFNQKGDRVPAHEVFASDDHGIPLVDTPLVKEGDHVLLKVENDFEYTFTPGFKPTGPENQVVNVYWVNEDGSLRSNKPLNQLPSSDNGELSPEQREVNTKLRDQVYKEGGILRTKIISKNIGEAKRGDKLNTLGILEFDYYNDQFQKLPFNPILGAVDKNGNMIFSGDTIAKAPKAYKDKIENLEYFPLTEAKAGSVVVVRQSPNGSLRVEILNERAMTDGELKFTQEELAKAFASENFENLDQVFYLPNHSTGVYRDTDSRTKRAKKPDLFKMDRTRVHRIQNQLAIPILSGSLQGWAVIEKNYIPRFLESKDSKIKRYWWKDNKMEKMVSDMPIEGQQDIRKIFDTLTSNKQRNIDHDKLNSELPYLDPATNETHKTYYDFLKATNALQTKLRGSLTPSSGQDTSYSYGQAAIYLDPNQRNIEVSVTPEEEIVVNKQEPLAPASTTPAESGRKPSFTKKKYKPAVVNGVPFKTISEREYNWFKDNFGEDAVNIAKNVDRFVAENGSSVFGTYYNALVTIAEYAPEGTLYHEAGHFVFDTNNGLINPITKNKILDEASKVYNLNRVKESELEEKLMEDFEKYKLSNGKYIPEVKSTRSFFAKLFNFIKKILGFKTQIEKLYEDIDTTNLTIAQRIRFLQNKKLTDSNMKFKLAPGFINSEQEADAILSFKTEAMNIIYQAVTKINEVGNVLTQPGRLEKILEDVRAKFRNEGQRILDKKAAERSSEEIDRLATLWATGVMEGANVDQDNVDYIGSWKDNQYGEFIDRGFRSKVIESLSDLGFVVKVNADLLELKTEDEAERLYDIDHTLLNPSNSISNRVKLLLHSIPQPTIDKDGKVVGYERTHLGTIKPLDFKAVDARLALKLADALNPYIRLTELAKIDPIAQVILDKLNDIKAKGDRQTFKEVLVKYRRDTVDKKTILHKTERKFIPIQERGPDNAAYFDQHSSVLIDSNRGSVFRSIIGDWREEAIRTNFITHNDVVTSKVIAVNNQFARLKAGRDKFTPEEVKTQFKAILKEMGIEVAPEVWKELDGLPKREKAFRLNSWVFGKQARSLESLLDDIHSTGVSPFAKETGTILEDLSKASSVYNTRVKTGAYLNDNGELEYPINTPSYLSELNNVFDDKELTNEFIDKHLQDDFYKNNKFLQALGDPKFRKGIKLSMLSAVRDRDRDTKMFADRTEIDSVLSRFTAYSSNNETYSNFFIGTPADKAKNPMMSLPRKKGVDALSFLREVLEGTIDSELVRIQRKGGNFLYIPELNSVPNLKSSLDKGEINPEEYTEARKQASKVVDTFITSNYDKFLGFLVENDIISLKDGRITNKRIPKGVLNRATPEAFLKEFFYNDTAWRLEMSKVFMGDFGFYKGQTDYFKRAYQLVTPGYKGFLLPGDAQTITRGIYPKQMKYNSPEIASLIQLGLSKDTAAEYAKGVNKTDAQSISTIHGYRKLADSLGLWSEQHEQVYNLAWGKGLTAREGLFNAERNGQITKAERHRLLQVKLQALKPFQYNEKETKVNGKTVIIKEQYKDSITPLIPELYNGHTGYSDLHEFMMAHGFDVMSAEDTVKVGLSDVIDFNQPVEDRHRKVVNLDSIRYPQLLPEASKEEVSGTQFHKLVMGDISDATNYDFRGKKITGSQIKELYHKVWEQKIREASESLQNKLGVDSSFTLSTDPAKRKEQFIKLQLMLKEELSTRDLNENYQDAIELVRTQLNTIDFSLPLSFPQLGEKFQGILTNVFKKKIFKEGTKTNGMSAVNLADYGVGRTDELQYIRNEKDEITEAEIGLPMSDIKSVGLKAVEHYNPKTMRIYWDKLSENQKKALQFIIYRIPTSNKSSMLPVRVAMITPSHLNNVVMIPGELTLQMGLDFDVDKSQLISRVLNDGKVNRDAADSRLFDIYWSILTNAAHLNAMLTPLTTVRLETIRDQYKEMGILSEESNSPFFTIQADARAESKNREEKVKVGIASRAATAHSVFNSTPSDLLYSGSVKFGLNGGSEEKLGKDNDDSGTLVSENLGVVQQAALDAAKTPLLALFNITKNLLPAAETYLLFGKNLDTVTDFFMQPIIRKWSETYIQQNEKERKAFDALATDYPELGRIYKEALAGHDSSFSAEELKSNLTSKIGDNPALEAKVLAELHYLLNLSKQVTNLTNVVSLETMSDAGSIEVMLVVQNQVNQATNREQDVYLDPKLFNLELAPKDGRRVAAFYKHGILDAVTYAGQFYPTTSIPYRITRQNILETLRLYPNVELYKKIDQFTNYHILQGDSKLHQALTQTSPTKKARQWSYVDEERSLFNHIQQMIKKYPVLLENELIKNIRDESSMRADMSLVGVRNTDDNSKTEVIGAWSDLLHADNEDIRQLGHDLVRYSIFTSGFTYHTASFVDLVPLDFWAKAGLDNIWKDTINNPNIDQDALLTDFVRHKYKSIRNFPEFYLDYKRNSDTILKSSIKEIKDGEDTVITAFTVSGDVFNEANPAPRFVIVHDNLYEGRMNHYKLLQAAGSRYFYEVSADGRKKSIHPDNKLGSPDPFNLSNQTKQFPALIDLPEGENQFIHDYLPNEKNDTKTVLEKLISEETNPQTLHTLHVLHASADKITSPIERKELRHGMLGVFEVLPLSDGTFTTSIALNSNMNVENPSQMRTTITHELIHAFTVGVLSNPQTEAEKSFTRNTERLAKEVNMSSYEFIAELASDPAFRARVQKKGLWANVLRLIRKVLGQKEEYDKVLDQMYDVIDHVESLQQFEPGAFYKIQQEKEEKKEPKKRLDALEKALSSLDAQERKLKEKGDKDAANRLSVEIDQLKKLSSTNRSQAVVKYLLIVDAQMKALKKTYDQMAKAPDKINPRILNPMRDQLLSYSLLDTFSNEVHNNPEAFVPVGGDSTQLLKAIADLKNDVYSLKAKTNSLVINRVAEAVNEALGGKENIQDLRENLQVADRDINWWSRMETSFSEIRDKFIKAAALIFKEVKYKAYRQSQEDLYRDTVKKETASIAIYENKWVRRPVSFNSTGMFKALNDYEAWMEENGKNAGSLADKFAPFINKESLKQDSKGIEFVTPWSKEGKEILKYAESNPLRQFYETFVLGYLKSQEQIKLPSMRPGFRIPTIGRTLLEGFLKEKGVKDKMSVISEQFANSFIERFDDAEYQQVNQHGEPQSGLPLRYTSRQDGENGRLTKKEVSLDIPSSIGLFMFEMNKREGMLAVQDDLELLDQTLSERKVMKTKRAGSYLSGETRGIPLANGEYATINGIESNVYAAYKDLMDRELYGITKKREGDLKIGEKKVSIAKGVDAFMRYTGMRIMLGKAAIPLTNLIVSELTLLKEIVGGNILTLKNYRAGQKFYAANAFKVLADLGKRQKETHLGRLLTFFNPMETLPAVGHIGVDTTRMRTIWDKVISTGGSTAEYKMAVTAFGAVMDKFNVINSNGKLESLDKGIEISNAGKITLKKGYKYVGKEGKQYEKGKSEMTDKDINQVIHYTLRTYQIMNGIYNIGDKPAANAYVVGRLANFMRSWLPAGIAARWNTKDFDERLGQHTEGHYISSLIALKNVYGKDGMLLGTLKNLKMLMWMGNNDPETLLLPEELNLSHEEKEELINMRKAGMRKTLFELYGIAVLGVLLFAAFGDDDDSYTKYMLARVRRELMTFIDPTTAWDVLRSPTVALNTVETLAGFISTARESIWAYASGDEQAIMERGPGKGMTKIGYRAKRLFGIDADMQFEDMGSKSRIIMNGGFK